MKIFRKTIREPQGNQWENLSKPKENNEETYGKNVSLLLLFGFDDEVYRLPDGSLTVCFWISIGFSFCFSFGFAQGFHQLLEKTIGGTLGHPYQNHEKTIK